MPSRPRLSAANKFKEVRPSCSFPNAVHKYVRRGPPVSFLFYNPLNCGCLLVSREAFTWSWGSGCDFHALASGGEDKHLFFNLTGSRASYEARKNFEALK